MKCEDCIHCKWDSDDGYRFYYCEENDTGIVEAGGECEDYKGIPLADLIGDE